MNFYIAYMKPAANLIKTGLVISSYFNQHSIIMNETTKTPGKIGFTPALIALIIGAIAMGVSPVFVREAEIGPFASAFWRVAIALPVLAIWARWELKRSGKKFRLNLSMSTVLAGVFFTGDLTFWHLSIVNTTMANATLLLCLAPAWVLIFSRAYKGAYNALKIKHLSMDVPVSLAIILAFIAS
ncbi:MAG: EamA family transporter, partial [Rhizobiaceae bacterium]|nr:EamA family transporter [Rhizobiaceae bacterium]